MQSIGPEIWFPAEVVISVSNDNVEFTELSHIKNTTSDEKPGTLFENFAWTGYVESRYIRYHALPNEVKRGWVFVDEIVIW